MTYASKMQNPSESVNFGLKFVIIGGGIGGLSASLSLARAGHSVTVLEAMDGLSDTGAGIQLFPNATRVLRRLGLEEFLKEHGVQPQAVNFRRCKRIWEKYQNAHFRFIDDTGEVIGSHDASNIEEECGAAIYNVHVSRNLCRTDEPKNNSLCRGVSLCVGCTMLPSKLVP